MGTKNIHVGLGLNSPSTDVRPGSKATLQKTSPLRTCCWVGSPTNKYVCFSRFELDKANVLSALRLARIVSWEMFDVDPAIFAINMAKMLQAAGVPTMPFVVDCALPVMFALSPKTPCGR